jgi:hypothetical protein
MGKADFPFFLIAAPYFLILTRKATRRDDQRREITEERRIKKFGAWLEVDAASFYLEDEAIGNGEWVFDATRGLELSHKMHIFIDNPDVIRTGFKNILPQMEIEVNIFFERKLEKLEKE